jgi:predicted MFS family arabinose efflux permease
MQLGLSRVIKILISSDFLLQAGWGLTGPIFAIFLTRQIEGGTVEMVGFIAATYWLVKSFVQPFIARWLDVRKGEKDDFKFLVTGLYIANLVPVGYLFSTHVSHIFILEFIRGLAMACVIPSWSAIFTRHISEGWEAFSWSMDSTAIGLAAGFAAAFGGILATILGFRVVFLMVSLLGLTSASVLLLIRNQIFSRDHFIPKIPPREKPF